MKKKYIFSIAVLISLLIILIPIAVAKEIESHDKLILKTEEQRFNVYGLLASWEFMGDCKLFGVDEDEEDDDKKYVGGNKPYEPKELDDAGMACYEQHEQISSFADSLDSGIISILNKIFTVLFTLCVVINGIDVVVSSIQYLIGFITGGCCHIPDPIVGPIVCAGSEAGQKAMDSTSSVIRPLCCFVNCGWCSGAKVGKDCWGIPGMEKFTPANLIPSIGGDAPASADKVSSGGIGEKGKKGIAQFGISPYDNIYAAFACLCPGAILFNMRKLKAIYNVYDCCIQEACKEGYSTEACEAQLDEATCMYYEGSIYSMLAKVLISILTNLITGVVLKNLAKQTVKSIFACVFVVWKIAQILEVLPSVKSAFNAFSETFDEPDCKDLGFERIKEEVQRDNYEAVTMIDKNYDGVYDTTTRK